MKDITGRIQPRHVGVSNSCAVCALSPSEVHGVHDSCRVCVQSSGSLVAVVDSSRAEAMEYEGGSSENYAVEVLDATVKQGMPVHTHVYVKGWFDRMRSGISVFKPVFSEEQVHQATKFRSTNEIFPIFSGTLVGMPVFVAACLSQVAGTTVDVGLISLSLAGLAGSVVAPFGLRKIIFGHRDKFKDRFFKESVAVNRKGFAVWLMNRYGITVSEATLEALFPDSRSALNELEIVTEGKFEDVKGKHWKLVRSDLGDFYVESLETRSNEAYSHSVPEPVKALNTVEYGLPAECQSAVDKLLQKIAVLAEEGQDSVEVGQVVERARGELSRAVQLFDRLTRLGREKDGVQQLAEVLALLNKHLDDTVNVLAAGVVSDFTIQSSFLRQVVSPPAYLHLDKKE